MVPQVWDGAGESQAGGGEGQELEQGSGPPGAAQGNLQGQAGQVQGEEEDAVPWWAVQYFPEETRGNPTFGCPRKTNKTTHVQKTKKKKKEKKTKLEQKKERNKEQKKTEKPEIAHQMP